MKTVHVLFALIFSLITLSGCAYYEDRAKYAKKSAESQPTKFLSADIHGDCPIIYRSKVEQKAREWGSVSRHHVNYNVAWDLSAVTIMQHSNDPLLICRPSLRDEHGHPICGDTTGTVIQLSMSEACDFEASAGHELGHFMGLPDLSNSEAIMNVSRTNRRISAVDVKACANIQFCPKPGHQDVTEVTVFEDPAIPRVEPVPPGWEY